MKKIAQIAIIVLLILLTGCTAGTPEVDTDTLNTVVAATMDAALASTQAAAPAKVAETAAPAPSITPAPEITLTSEPGSELPTEAASDLKIAYTDGQGDLWFWQSGGTPALLVEESDIYDFALSPDGSQVFFSRTVNYTDFSLWLINTDGSDERQVMSAAEFDAMPRPGQASGTAPTQLGWVPGSKTAVFTTYYYFDGPGVDTGDDLYLVNGVTGSVSTLLEPGQGGGMYFYSPDGEQIALATPNQIDLINSDGSNRRSAVLTYEDIFMYTESPFYAQPVWSADGTKLRVILLAQDRLGKPEEPSSVWEIPAAGGEAVKLLNFYTNGLGPGASISPDLTLLAYFQNVNTGGQQDLHIASLDGSTDEIYAGGSLNWTTWAGDSQRFVWTKYGEVGAARQVFLGEVGADPIQLGAPQTPHILSWVAGDLYLFLENEGDTPPSWKLYLGTVGGSNQLLVDLAAGDRIPQFEFVE
jgi:hypothetical protein